MKNTKHHIWCNLQNPLWPDDGKAEDCEMCIGLRQDHPELPGDVEGEELIKKYFPNNKLIR